MYLDKFHFSIMYFFGLNPFGILFNKLMTQAYMEQLKAKFMVQPVYTLLASLYQVYAVWVFNALNLTSWSISKEEL